MKSSSGAAKRAGRAKSDVVGEVRTEHTDDIIFGRKVQSETKQWGFDKKHSPKYPSA
jgi:hypothetical protein